MNNRVSGMYDFDLVKSLKSWYTKHRSDLKLFGILYLVNIFIFGQRLFFYMLPSDDYMRFSGDNHARMLITHSARWAQAYLEKYLFVGHLEALPYLHPLIGIAIFTLMGYLTAKYWRLRGALEKAVVTLLISATPMFAHNLLFSSNISVWILLLAGQAGFLLAHRRGIAAKVVGLVLLVLSIAAYQTIIQIIAAMVVVRMLFEIVEAPHTREVVAAFRYGIVAMGFVAVAYVVSYEINQALLAMHHWHPTHRLAQATDTGILAILVRLKSIYTTPLGFHYFHFHFHALYGVLALVVYIAILLRILLQNAPKKVKTIKILSVTLLFGTFPLIANLPLLLGVEVPLRAHLTVGWLVAGAVALVLVSVGGILRSLTLLGAAALLVLSAYYITLFYDAAQRQSEADIDRARTIVERIRMHPGYDGEPIALYILGQKPFSVEGWHLKWQQPFDSIWAKYAIFYHFTDLKFHMANSREKDRITRYILKHHDKKLHAFPHKDSVIVHDGVAMLILDPAKINALIKRKELLTRMPRRAPDAKGDFDVYVEDRVVYYKKQPCSRKDLHRFFLRVYPSEDEKRDFIGRTRIRPFQNMDFRFDWFGEMRDDGSCVAIVELPDYPIEKIRTGQVSGKKILWDTTVDLNETNATLKETPGE